MVAAVRADGSEAVAVGLLFSFAHPEHEAAVAAALREALPDVHVSASSEVLPEIREYERISTTAVDAYLTPVAAPLPAPPGRARGRGRACRRPAIMQSSGGVLPIADSAEHAAWTVLSGPAGGVIGAARLAARRGRRAWPSPSTWAAPRATSRWCATARPARTSATVIAGHPLHLPMLDVATVSAGGGSIAWADSGGALRVGPHSAGARPGPAAYGLGGTEPTVTDADVVLGPPARRRARSAGASTSTPTPRRAAVGRPGRRARPGRWRSAPRASSTVAVQEMVRALRLVSVERGEDPREATLIAFGGAGPLHACPVADELGIAARARAAGGRRARGPRPGRSPASAATTSRPCWPRWTAAPTSPALLAPLRERAGRELPGAGPQRGRPTAATPARATR